jgi:hypothetical protein
MAAWPYRGAACADGCGRLAEGEGIMRTAVRKPERTATRPPAQPAQPSPAPAQPAPTVAPIDDHRRYGHDISRFSIGPAAEPSEGRPDPMQQAAADMTPAQAVRGQRAPAPREPSPAIAAPSAGSAPVVQRKLYVTVAPEQSASTASLSLQTMNPTPEPLEFGGLDDAGVFVRYVETSLVGHEVGPALMKIGELGTYYDAITGPEDLTISERQLANATKNALASPEWSSTAAAASVPSVDEGGGHAPGTDLSPENVKELFTKAMRAGVAKYAKVANLTNEKDVYGEALKFALITYDNVVAGLNPSLEGVIQFPRAEEITGTEYIEALSAAIKNNQAIRGEGWQEHYEEYRKSSSAQQGQAQGISAEEPKAAVEANPDIGGAGFEEHHAAHLASSSTQQGQAQGISAEESLKKFSAGARSKIAGSWAGAAATVVRLRELLAAANRPSHSQALLAATAAREGRDVPGRLAYRLVNAQPEGIADALLGNDPKEGAGTQRGTGQLGLDIANAFTDAACHNDARQMSDLMSQKLFAKGSMVVGDERAIQQSIQKILVAIDQCPGARQVLKLTNFANHSALYLVGDKQATKYESIAGTDSNTILYNHLIRYDVTRSQLKPTLDAGARAIAAGGEKILRWEVHQATTLEQLRARVEERLRRGTTEVTLGLALAAHEKQQEVETRGDEAAYGDAAAHDDDAPQGDDAAHGLDLARYKNLAIPRQLINTDAKSSVTLYNLSDTKTPGQLVPDAQYRMNARGRWMLVTYIGTMDAEGLPDWMNPCEQFHLEEVGGRFERPQLRALRQGEQITSVLQFVMQVTRQRDLLGPLSQPSSADYPKRYGDFVIVEDPFWETGGASRRIIYKNEKTSDLTNEADSDLTD